MSTEVGMIKGTWDGSEDLSFTQVGRKKGVFVQITQGMGGQTTPGFITINREEAYKTVEILVDWLHQTIFCNPNCRFLSPTEKEQDIRKIGHMCTKFKKRVYHKDKHPLIYRVEICDEE